MADFLSKRKYVVLDGGTATESERLQDKLIHGDPLWSARFLKTNPDLVKQVHKNFLEAGSDVVVTASYQASIAGFTRCLEVDENEALGLMARSVNLAREACQETGRPGIVAGSVGPHGAALHDGSEYTGSYIDEISFEDLKTWHRPRVKSLLEAGADILAVETIPAQTEAEAVVELLQEFPGSSAWVSFSCKDGRHTCHGELLADAVRSVAQSSHVIATGINCTAPEHVSSLLESLRHVNQDKPIIVKPNSGEAWDTQKGWYGRDSSPMFTSKVREWAELGATWIGGCCRIYPKDIAAIRHELDAMMDRG